MQKQKVKSKTAVCRNCKGPKKRGEFSSKTISGSKVLQCKRCGYYNSSEIFYTFKEIKKQQITFGEIQ